MQRNIAIYTYILTGLLLTTACKKSVDEVPQPVLASVTVVNTAIGLGSVQVDPFTGTLIYANLTDSIVTGAFEHYTLPSGSVHFKVVARADTTKTIVNTTYAFSPAGIYSLYITGQAPAYDTIMVAENSIPVYTDSAIGVRLINLAPGSSAVDMALIATSSGYDFTGVAYKQQTGFKKYPLLSNPDHSATTFQVLDPNDQTVLASYTLPAFAFSQNPPPTISAARFRAITLVFMGTASQGYSLFAVSNY